MSLYDKLLAVSLATLTNSCYAEANSIEKPRTEPMVITEPGTYKVIPRDVFKGPLGTDLRVDEIDENGAVKSSYINSEGGIEFSDIFANGKHPIAFYRLRIIIGDELGTLTLTDNIEELYDRCFELSLLQGWNSFDCSLVSPTEALDGEVLVESPSGYFGKVNDAQYSPLATCAAMDLESSVKYTSEFLGLPRLTKGASQLYVFSEKNPKSTGIATGNVSAWFYNEASEKGIKSIKYELSLCDEKISKNEFDKATHEVTHLITVKYTNLMPNFFLESVANFVVPKLNGTIPEWATPESICQEEGVNVNGKITPYFKWDETVETKEDEFYFYQSGKCFWVKMTNAKGDSVISQVFDELDNFSKTDNPSGDQEIAKNIFEEALQSAGVNLNHFKKWGLGE